MKKLIYIIITILGTWSISCDVEEGYLIADETAGYSIDSLVVYVNPPASSSQAKYGTPYFTTSVEGIEGTNPKTYSLFNVTSPNGDAAIMKEQIRVEEGIGKIVIPVEHTIPVGEYWVGISVENCYGSLTLENIIKIIVK
ncbi:MAG: hypothetical protein SOY65_06780 [Marinifilaceae bacterium]|nr:hypothetical protein [Marinifilaceae bacterium]